MREGARALPKARSQIAGVILAAGTSSRMGSSKALLSIGGEPALVRLVRIFSEAALAPIVVAGMEEVPGAIRVPGGEQMIDSLAHAIEAIPEDAEAAVVQPVDAPFTTVEAITALIARSDQARVLAFEGTPGHPVLVPRSLFAGIAARPKGGLKTLLGGAELVSWDRSVLADLDTPADLAVWGLRHD